MFKAKSMNDIRDNLNSEGVPTRSGKRWERAMIDRILTNPIYYGELIYNKHFRRKTSLNGKCRWGVNPEEKWVKVEPEHTEIKPIIEKELFNKAQEIRKAKLRLGAVSVYNDYLFSGLAKCGVCDSKMYSRKVTARYKRKYSGIITKSCWPGYVCGKWARFNDTDKNYISESDIKEAIMNDLQRYKENPGVLEGFLQASNLKQVTNASKMIKVISHNIEKIEIRRKRLIILFSKQKINEQEFDEAISELDKEKEANEIERGKFIAELANNSRRKLGRKEFKTAIVQFENIFDKKDIQSQKLFLRSLIDSIIIYKRKIQINYSL